MLRKTVNFFIFLLFSFSTTAYGDIESEKIELHSRFDKLILNLKDNSAFKIKTLFKKGNVQTTMDFGKGQETVDISIDLKKINYISTLDGWGKFKKDPNSLSKFDFSNGIFTTKYIYKNKLYFETPIELTIKTAAITRILEKSLLNAENKKIALEKEEDFISKQDEEELLKPIPENAVNTENETEFNDTKALETDDDEDDMEFYECDAGAGSQITATMQKLKKIRKMTKLLFKAAGEYDHLWTLAFTGSDGVKNLCQGLVTINPLTALYGAAQLAVAAKSGMRAYNELSERCSSDASALLDDINESAKQIEDISLAMTKMLNTIGEGFSGIEQSLNNIVTQQNELSKFVQEASEEEQKDLQKISRSYEKAREASLITGKAFAEFKIAESQIRQSWQIINEMFRELIILMQSPLSKEGDPRELFKIRMLEINDKIIAIQNQIDSLNSPMAQQEILSKKIAEQREIQDKHLADANENILKMAAKISEKNKFLLKKIELSNAKLEEARATISNNFEIIQMCETKVDEVNKLAISIQEDAICAKKKVARMYKTRDLLIGAGVTCLCSPIGGPATAMLLGLACTKASQMVGSKWKQKKEKERNVLIKP